MNDNFEISEINQAVNAYCGIPGPRPDADLTLADILAQRIALPPDMRQGITVETREKRARARAKRKRKAKLRKQQLRKGH